MTLCIVWRDSESIHFCSDSRLTFGDGFADVAVKVMRLPVSIYSPRQNGSRTVDHSLELGMCFSGSSAVSLIFKETLAELVKELQYAPGHTDKSMRGLANLMFNGYRSIAASLHRGGAGAAARMDIVIAGRCPVANELQAFLMQPDSKLEPVMTPILEAPGSFEIIGDAQARARSLLPAKPRAQDYLRTLKEVIDDPDARTVGGPIQYGTFQGDEFRCFGVAVLDGSGARYWRAGLDINGADFIGGYGNFIPVLPLLDLSFLQPED
jgi:hypothetical protein